MNDDIRCECGHVNPVGTVLCEACGRVIADNHDETKLLDMRYEGSARRSQTYNKSLIDKIWNFFSSVKVGVTLIVIALVSSALGTILPQEAYIPDTVSASDYYQQEYGILGKLYYTLGLHNLFSSWWYLIIIGMLGISLLIASIDRFFPLYRSLKNQRVIRHDSFMKRQRIYGITEFKDEEVDLEKIKQSLKKHHYKIHEENGNILAEKGRFARWGPYINHLGLIIVLIGAMLRSFPGMYVDKILWLREGETKEIPGTNGKYYLKNNAFIFEVYDKKNKEDKIYSSAIDKTGMIAKNYQANVTLYKQKGNVLPGEKPELEKVKDEKIRVNQPLKYDHYALYQSGYKLDEFSKMSFNLIDKKSEKSFGMITVDLNNPHPTYPLKNGYSVELMSYFPDFEFKENGEPSTKTRIPNNPAFIFKMYAPDKPKGEVSFVAIRQNVEPMGENKYKMSFSGIEMRNATALTVRRDYTIGILMAGGIIFMLGVIQGAYWHHRRIWIKRKDNEIILAAHTNKNWYGLKRDISVIVEETPLSSPTDQLDGEIHKGEAISG